MHERAAWDFQRIGAALGVSLVAALIVLSFSHRACAAGDLAAPPISDLPTTVFVELRTNDPRVRIDRIIDGHTTQPVCRAPCGQTLDRDGVYVIGGDGIPKTSPFTLPGDQSRLTLTVDPGSRAEWFAGMGLLFVGGAATVLGSPGDPGATNPHPSRFPLLIGLGGIVVGLVGLVLLDEAPTRVTSSTGRTFSRLLPSSTRRRAKPSALAIFLRALAL